MTNIIVITSDELQNMISSTIQAKLVEQIGPLIKEVSKDRISDSRRLNRREAARIEGISISMLDKMCRQGKYTRIKAGKKTLFDINEKGRVI